MGSFLARAEKGLARMQAASDHSFAKRALCKFCEGFEIDVAARKHDPEFGFGWFHDEYPRFPMRLDAKRTEIALEKAIRDMPKAWFWNVYLGLLEQTSFEYLAMFAPVVKGGFYTVHNNLSLPLVSGFARLTYSGHEGKGIVVESMAAFIASLKKAGVNP